MYDIKKIMDTSPVVPVLVIENAKDALPLAKSLVKGGLKVLEITLRTDAALEAIKIIRGEVPDAIVGAGTVTNAKTLQAAEKAGSQFFVSPGISDSLIDAAKYSSVPLLPGIATPTEAMRLFEMGFNALKFFPAEAAGGTAMLKAISGPLPQLDFCPTGGINPQNAPNYLALNNVRCIGGSWMAPAKMVAEHQWDEITKMAKIATNLG